MMKKQKMKKKSNQVGLMILSERGAEAGMILIMNLMTIWVRDF